MATDIESDLSNTYHDDEHSMDSSYKMDQNHDKSIKKRPKPTMQCVVCGDHAFGKMNS